MKSPGDASIEGNDDDGGLVLEAKEEYTTHVKHRKKSLLERMTWLVLGSEAGKKIIR